MKNITILGSGSWGVALAIHLNKQGHKIKLWSYSENEADLINNENKCKFLPNIILDKNIKCYTNYEEAIEGSDFILFVTPAKAIRNVAKECKSYIKNQTVILCSKGIEQETNLTLIQVVEEEIPGIKIGALSRTKPCRRSG